MSYLDTNPQKDNQQMDEHELPPWGNDWLSERFKEAQDNERASARNLPGHYDLLKRLHEFYKDIQEALEKDPQHPELDYSRALIVRTHGSLFAALRVVMGGQVLESYPLLRGAIERAWYALHMADDPRRIPIWRDRHTNPPQSVSKCRNEFSAKNIYEKTHKKLDPTTADELWEIYELLIDYGGHPNIREIAETVIETGTGHGIAFLYPEPKLMDWAVKMAIRTTVLILKTFQLIYPSRFEMMNFDRRLNEFITQTKGFTVKP